MKTNENCKKLNLTCWKLKGKCSKKLNVAIGNSKPAKKCKTNLKDNGNKKVDSFCALQCKICNKILFVHFNEFISEQVKLGFTRACRSIDKLGKKGLKTK